MTYIEKGAQQLLAAAVPTFPPAAAIGTALTYLLGVLFLPLHLGAGSLLIKVIMAGMRESVSRLRRSDHLL